MRINLKNRFPVKFHPNRIWNDGAFGFCCRASPQRKNNKMSSDIRSVPDPKIIVTGLVIQTRYKTFYSSVLTYDTTVRSINFSVNWFRVLRLICHPFTSTQSASYRRPRKGWCNDRGCSLHTGSVVLKITENWKIITWKFTPEFFWIFK